MDVNHTKTFLIEWLKGLQDKHLLEELAIIAQSHTNGDWWNELPATAKESILKGNQDFLEGKVISNDLAQERIAKKFGI